MQRYYVATVSFAVTAASQSAAIAAIENAVIAYNAEQSKAPNGSRNYVTVAEVIKVKEDRK